MAGTFFDSFLPALTAGATPLPKTMLDYQSQIANIGNLESQTDLNKAHAAFYNAGRQGPQNAAQAQMQAIEMIKQGLRGNPNFLNEPMGELLRQVAVNAHRTAALEDAMIGVQHARGESFNALTGQRDTAADLNVARTGTEHAKAADISALTQPKVEATNALTGQRQATADQITALTQPKVEATTNLSEQRQAKADETRDLLDARRDRMNAQADAARASSDLRKAQEADVRALTPGKVSKLQAESRAVTSLEDLRKARANYERERAKFGRAGASGGSAMTLRMAEAFKNVGLEMKGGEPADQLDHGLVNRYLHGVDRPLITETTKTITPGKEKTRQEKLTPQQSSERMKLNDLATQAVKKAMDAHRGWFGVDKDAAKAELGKVMEHATDEEHAALRAAMEEAGL